MPKVSVVIPTHNRATLLDRAVASVLTQTFADFEILIVDDASTDGTRDRVLEIADARVRYWRHDRNRGVSEARNTGLSHASGDFVAFLDDDDEWFPAKLSLQMERFEQANPSVGLVGCGHHVIGPGSERVIGEVLPRLRGRVFEQVLRQGFLSHTSTIVARRECFERVGVFDPSYSYGEDLDMWLRIAGEYEVDFVAKPLARRCRQAACLSRQYDGVVAGIEAHVQKYREFFANNPDVFATQLQNLGTAYCFAGNATAGRRLLWQAILRQPLETRTYFRSALSLFGSRAFRSWYATKEALVSRMENARRT